MKVLKVIKKYLTKCSRCNKLGATNNKQLTQYQNDEDNFQTLCPKCQIDEDEYWKERWKEYHSGCL